MNTKTLAGKIEFLALSVGIEDLRYYAAATKHFPFPEHWEIKLGNGAHISNGDFRELIEVAYEFTTEAK